MSQLWGMFLALVIVVSKAISKMLGAFLFGCDRIPDRLHHKDKVCEQFWVPFFFPAFVSLSSCKKKLLPIWERMHVIQFDFLGIFPWFQLLPKHSCIFMPSRNQRAVVCLPVCLPISCMVVIYHLQSWHNFAQNRVFFSFLERGTSPKY